MQKLSTPARWRHSLLLVFAKDLNAVKPFPLFSAALALATLVLVPGGAFAQAAGDGALDRCLAMVGAPDPALPARADVLEAIRAAEPDCDQAVADGTATADVYFQLGILAQAKGDLAEAMDFFRQAAWLGLTAASGEAVAMTPERADEVARPGAVAETAEAADAPSTPAPDQPAPASAAARCAALAGAPDSGVPVSPAALEASLTALRKARPFCEQAIEAGAATGLAHFQLAVLLQNQGRHQAALSHFRAAADMGLAAAHSKLGDYLLFGIGPVKADVDKAVAEYRQAADGGDLSALTTLALLYRLGRGVPRDPARMLALMQKAADGGYHFAQYRLAQTFLTGDGIPGGADPALGVPNPALGVKYLEMAARQGNSKAILELAGLYASDAGGVAQDLAAHAYWTERAAETGDPAALAALGLIYETGRGVEKDPARAAALYVQALESGKLSLAELRRDANGRTPPWERATAKAFQTILQQRGLYKGAIDGVVGPMTRAAARALAP